MSASKVPPPRLHGKTIYEWTKLLGPCTMKEIKEYVARQMELDFDEDRIDVIGSNGNTGEHYDLSKM